MLIPSTPAESLARRAGLADLVRTQERTARFALSRVHAR